MKTIGACVLGIVCMMAVNGTSLAQNAPIDFEPGGFGATWTWTVFENGTNPPLEIVANPAIGGVNTSATVAKFTALQSGQPWAGTESMHGSDIGTFTLDETNSTVKIMVYKSVISDVGIKFVVNNGGSTGEIKVSNTLVGQWEEITFDFSGKIGEPTSTDIDQIVIFPDFDLGGRTGNNLIYFDNITFSEMTPGLTGPSVAAPTPTVPADSVISLFSNAYTNVPVDTWSASWDLADVQDTTVAGDDVKLYTNLIFAGIEFTSQTIDASGMTHFHMDIWTPDETASPAVFRIKLVDFGANGVFGGGDDVEHELSFNATTNPPLVTGEWIGFDLPLASFTGLVTREHMAQLIISGDLNTVWADNVYFYAGEAQASPTVPAPTPTEPAENVISLFSNAYTDVPVDTWSAVWDLADVTDTTIAGDDVKLYTNLIFAGIEFTSQTINANEMTHFHMDIWTPDETASPAVFRIKLVDFGANGVFGGGDDVEHELTFDENSTPPLVSEDWVSFDIPLSDFSGLVTREHLAQLIISGDPNTVWVDNVYFYTTITDVKEVSGTVPAAYGLEQNYPNPFNPTTRIQFSLPEAAHVTLTVYNLLGQQVMTVLDEFMNAGTFSTTVDGASLPSGTYVYSISAGGFTSVKKMILLK